MSYIGQTKNSFEERYNDSGKWWVCTGNCHLKNSAKKHGHENFKISILQDNISSIAELNRLEIKYIKKYKTLHPNGYNFCIGGNNKQYTQNICDKISAGLRKGKTYQFKSPEGKIFEVENLARFCQENGLSRTMMVSLNREDKRYKQHKGWTLPDVELEEKKFISPSGKLYTLRERELRQFCRENNLHHGAMGDVWREKYLQYKGWKKYHDKVSVASTN